MSTHLSLYRKWRPQSFRDVVGQKHVVRTLTNALTSGRLAHAYLLSGPRGTGKTTMARLLSKGLNCVQGPTAEPCGDCEPCRHIRDGSFLDVIEIDAASNRGIEEIRDLREKIRYAPSSGRYKVYILDEVHMLTTEAFNALLKVLEEPPAHAVFIFATTEPHRIPATIVSRCQRFDFRPLLEEEVVDRLALIAEREAIPVERGALALIARRAQGGMRDAEATLDQCVSFQTGEVALSEAAVADILGVVPAERLQAYVAALREGDGPAALRLVQQLAEEGRDLRQFNRDVISDLRGRLEAKVNAGVAADADEADGAEVTSEGEPDGWSVERLLGLIERLTAVDADMRFAEEPRLPLELGVLRWISSGRPEGGEKATGGARQVEAPPPDGELSGPDGQLHERVEELDRQLLRVTRSLAGLQREVQKLSGGASAPEAPKATAPPPGSGAEDRPAQASLTLDRVKEVWPSVMERLRQRSVKVEAFLREATPAVAEADGRIMVTFSSDHAFHLSNMQQEPNRRIAEQVLSQALGTTVRLDCRPSEGGEQPDASGRAQPHPPAPRLERRAAEAGDSGAGESEPRRASASASASAEAPEIDAELAAHPAVEAALKLFGGTIVEVKSDDGEA